MRLSRFSSSLSAGVLCAFGYLSPQIALAADAAPATPTAEVAAAGDTKTSDAFVSKGAPMAIESLGVVITPPTGWEVSTNTGSLSVVMREPKQTAPDYVNAKYQKNITIAAIHSASPIDEKRAVELEAQLVKAFSADATVSDFKIMEHKFFNYHGANDGLLVYSSLNIGEYPMMQMHVLVSGQQKQFLLSYTDLARTFGGEKDAAYTAAWESMVSIQVAGDTPQRQSEYLRYGAVAGSVLALILLGCFFHFRANRVDYKSDADAMIDSEDSDMEPSTSNYDAASVHSAAPVSSFGTMNDAWHLGGHDEVATSSVRQRAKASPKTKPSSQFVSNY